MYRRFRVFIYKESGDQTHDGVAKQEVIPGLFLSKLFLGLNEFVEKIDDVAQDGVIHMPGIT